MPQRLSWVRSNPHPPAEASSCDPFHPSNVRSSPRSSCSTLAAAEVKVGARNCGLLSPVYGWFTEARQRRFAGSEGLSPSTAREVAIQ